MVHTRVNERETKPNPHINFISVLLNADPESSEMARQRLRALAAQVRPVMKAHGFEVNSLEEYEHNRVFLGRNWNNGETIELVLRQEDGRFHPISWVMSTFCHELAHIKHMDHGPAFQALWRKLRHEVLQLQQKGYFGDGYWSSGTRLSDSAVVVGEGDGIESMPEFVCGGAQTRSRSSALRKRRRRTEPSGRYRGVAPSLWTGQQTRIQRKAGTRVKSKYAFKGEGETLDADSSNNTARKRATSNRAREERAIAAERRLKLAAGDSARQTPDEDLEEADGSSDTEYSETDEDRRAALLESDTQERTDWASLLADLNPRGDPGEKSTVISSSSNLDSQDGNARRHVKSFAPDRSADSQISRKRKRAEDDDNRSRSGSSVPSKKSLNSSHESTVVKRQLPIIEPHRSSGERTLPKEQTPDLEWSCDVCTLLNREGHLACSACATPRFQSDWIFQ